MSKANQLRLSVTLSWWQKDDLPQMVGLQRLTARGRPLGLRALEKSCNTPGHLTYCGFVEKLLIGFATFKMARKYLFVKTFFALEDYKKDFLKKLIGRLKAKLSTTDQTGVYLSIPESDTAALEVLSKEKFFALKLLKNSFAEGFEDGILMKYEVPEAAFTNEIAVLAS